MTGNRAGLSAQTFLLPPPAAKPQEAPQKPKQQNKDRFRHIYHQGKIPGKTRP